MNSGIAGYKSLLDRYPDLGRAIEDVVAALSTHAAVESVILWGGVALGAYSPASSDVDLVAVVSGRVRNIADEVRELLGPVEAAHPGVDVLLIEEADVGSRAPLGHSARNGIGVGRFHEMDMIQIAQLSVLLYGKDFRSRMVDYDASEVIGGIIEHVVSKMLPPVIRRAECDGTLPEGDMFNLTFVMSRCLYTLYTGGITTKPGSADWLRLHTCERPRLQPLEDLALEFAGWYCNGHPQSADLPMLTREFVAAAEAFREAVRAEGLDA